MNGTQVGFFDSLMMTVRDNPLAAALIGGGAFWLLVGDERLKNAARSATAAASPVVDMGAQNLRAAASEFQRIAAPPTAPEMNHDGSFGLGQMVRDGGAAASDSLSAAGDKVRDRFDEGVAYARENFGKLGSPLSGKEALAKARSSLTDILERQPLVLGPLGLAIGAAVASAFRTSEFEHDWMGELREDVKADLHTRADAVSQSLGQSANTLIAELSDSAAEAVDRLKEVGMDAGNAAWGKVKAPRQRAEPESLDAAEE